MEKRAYVLLLALLLLLTGCSAAAPAAEDAAATAPAVENSAEIPASTEPEKAQPSLLPGQVDIVTADKDKPVREAGEPFSTMNSQEYAEQYGEEIEENSTQNGTDLSGKIYVYPERTLREILWPGVDAAEYQAHGTTLLTCVMAQVPTEAVRETEQGLFYLVHDTDTHMRVFSFFLDSGEEERRYDRVGYPIYMAQTLSYSDFAGVESGTSVEDVKMIDPQIVPLYIPSSYNPREIETCMRNGQEFFSIHLLSDGILKLTYKLADDKFCVKEVIYSEDFTLNCLFNTFTGERMDICYQIDPLDYVVNSSLTE